MSVNHKNLVKSESSEIILPRRQFVGKSMLFGLSAIVAPTIFIPKICHTPEIEPGTLLPLPQKKVDYAISMYNIHTGEHLKKCQFWCDGEFNPEGLKQIRHFFRDYRTQEEIDIDPSLMQLLHQISKKLESTESIHLISGYRSPKTNRTLNARSCGVAKNSQHLYGKAADIMIPGRSLKNVQAAAKSLRSGGVGRYSNFVHVDTGRIRYWGLA